MMDKWIFPQGSQIRLRAVMLFGLAISLVTVAFAQEPTLRVWSISVEQNDLYREVEAAFHDEYPQWTVRFETQAQDSFKQTLPLSFESGDAPDLILAGLDIPMKDLLANGWLAPVAGGQEIADAWFDRFPANTFVNGHNMVDGVVYGVPTNEQDIWGPGYLYYNREVLRAAGVDPDTEVPATWSELLAVCEQVKVAGFSCFTAAFDTVSNIRRWWIPFTSVAQSWSSMNYQTGHFSYADPNRLRAWELLKTMYDSGYFIPGVATTNKETSRQIFALGQAAFYMDGAWMPSVFRTGMGFPDLDFGVAAIPVPDDGIRGKLHKALLSSRLHVTSQVSNPEAAWALVEFLTRPEGVYAKGYVGGGFGFLSFTDNSKWVDPNDEVLQAVISLGQNGLRVFEPAPLLACSDMARSTAFRDAETNTAFPAEETAVVEALVTGSDWAETAQEIAAGRQLLFEQNLAEERERGLNVSLDYFTYPDWEFATNFDYSVYPLCSE